MLSNTLISEIIELLNNELLVATFARAFRGFDKEKLSVPIKTMLISVIPKENKATYFEDENARACKKTELTIGVTVYAPATQRGTLIQSIGEVSADFVSEAYMGSCAGYSVGDLTFDDGVNALVLPVEVKFCYYSCPLEDDGGDDVPVVPDSFFCKQHTSDATVHLSEKDRLLISEPFVVGGYTGTGVDSYQDIELGFQPRLVIVYRNSYHISSYVASEGISKCYLSVATVSSYTRGLLINASGFRVRTVVTTNATAHLNDSGGSYTYIAFR